MWKKEMTEDEIDDYYSHIYKTKDREVIYKDECGEIYRTSTCDIYDGNVLKLSYEEFIESIEDSIFNSPEEFICYLIENFDEEQYRVNDGLPLMTEIHNEILDSYSDYKRGYTEHLYVYELDYRSFNLKVPKNKKDRIYLGVEFTLNNWGESRGFSIKEVKRHDKKIVVTKWISK